MKTLITVLFIFAGTIASYSLDPLPTLPIGPVAPKYDYRERTIEIPPAELEDVEDTIMRCLFPGNTCRF